MIQGAPSDGQPGSLSAGAALRTTAVPCRTVASCRSTSRLCAFRSSPCCPPQRTWLRWRSNGTTSCRISTRIPQRAERIRPQPTGGDGSSQGRSTGIVAQADTTPGAPATVAKIWLQGLAAAVSQAAPHTSPTGDNVPRLPSFSGYSPASISRVLGCPQCPDKDGETTLTAPERVAVRGPDQRKHARGCLVRPRIGRGPPARAAGKRWGG